MTKRKKSNEMDVQSRELKDNYLQLDVGVYSLWLNGN